MDVDSQEIGSVVADHAEAGKANEVPKGGRLKQIVGSIAGKLLVQWGVTPIYSVNTFVTGSRFLTGHFVP